MDTISLVIRIIVSLAAGFLAGYYTTYIFNRIPAKWLCDYDQEPDKEMWGERIPARPWNIVFALVMAAVSIKLTQFDILYQLAALPALWFLLYIAIADTKYMIIPDQFIIALAVSGLGFIPFHDYYLSPAFGALIGGGSLLLIGIIAHIMLKKEAMGFGDVKLMAAVGLLSGIKGIIIISIITIFAAGFFLGIGVLAGRYKKDEEKPLGPFIAASSALYILFQEEIVLLADLYLSIYQ